MPIPRLLVHELRLDDPSHDAAIQYVVSRARNPDPGSIFEAKTKHLQALSDADLMHLLPQVGYDGILFLKDGVIIGHVFFQKHGPDWHMFSLAVDPEHQGNGLANTFAAEFLEEAWRMEVKYVYFGKGGGLAVIRLADKALRGELGLSFSISSGDMPFSLKLG